MTFSRKTCIISAFKKGVLNNTISQVDRCSDQELCERKLEGVRYFIIGLSHGVTEGDNGPMCLPLDIGRYADSAKAFVLFDAPVLQFIGNNGQMPDGDLDGWGDACDDMEARLVGIPDISIVKASDVCAVDPQGYMEIYQYVLGAMRSDAVVSNKIWQIVPPSVKGPNGFDLRQRFSELDGDDQGRAIQLAEYEIAHVALILFSQGGKILHGRTEQRSRQVVNRLKSGFPEWKGEVVDPKSLRGKRLISHKYPNPYALFEGLETPEDVYNVIVEGGQVPLNATLQLGEAMRFYIENGEEESLRRYLEVNLGDVPDLSTIENVYLAASAIMSDVIWDRFERAQFEVARDEDRIRAKVLSVLSDFCLSPDLEVLLNVLMPRFCGRWDSEDVAESVRFLLENVPSAIAVLPIEYEKAVMGRLIGVLEDLYVILGGSLDEIIVSSWAEEVMNIDQVFNEGRFCEVMGQVGLAGDASARCDAVSELVMLKDGIELLDRMGSSEAMLMFAGTSFDYRGVVLSWAARRCLFERIIVPYLAMRGDSVAFACLRRIEEFGHDRTRYWDVLIERYSDARAADLGLNAGDRVDDYCSATTALGMDVCSPSARLLHRAFRDLVRRFRGEGSAELTPEAAYEQAICDFARKVLLPRLREQFYERVGMSVTSDPQWRIVKLYEAATRKISPMFDVELLDALNRDGDGICHLMGAENRARFGITEAPYDSVNDFAGVARFGSVSFVQDRFRELMESD